MKSFVHEVWKRRALLALAVLAAAPVVGCGLRTHEVSATTSKKDVGDRSGPSSTASLLGVGQTLREIRGRTMDGRPVKIDLLHRNESTLLFVLSPSCPYCRVNFHHWRDIASKAAPQTGIVWLDLSGTSDWKYLQSFGISNHDTFVLLDGANSAQMEGVATPTTLFVDHAGVVRWLHSGVMSDSDAGALEGLIGE